MRKRAPQPWESVPDERDCRRNPQTHKGLMATAAALLADLIKEAFCASSSAQRSANDGTNAGGFPHRHHVIGKLSLS